MGEFFSVTLMRATKMWSQNTSIAPWWLATVQLVNIHVSRWDISQTRDLKYMPNNLFPKMVSVILGRFYLTDECSSVDSSDRFGFIQWLSVRTTAQSGCFSFRPSSRWDGLFITQFFSECFSVHCWHGQRENHVCLLLVIKKPFSLCANDGQTFCGLVLDQIMNNKPRVDKQLAGLF